MKDKAKEIEKALLDYAKDNTTYHHKEKALREINAVGLRSTSHIAFIVEDYPDYDHILIKGDNEKNWFVRIGFNKEYLQSLSKKEIHILATNLATMFEDFDFTEGI